VHEKKTFLCSHCSFRIEFSERERESALERASAHEQACEANPLVIRIKELEAQVLNQAPAAAQPAPAGDTQALVEVLMQIRLESRKRQALTKAKDVGTLVSFSRIEAMVDKVLG